MWCFDPEPHRRGHLRHPRSAAEVAHEPKSHHRAASEDEGGTSNATRMLGRRFERETKYIIVYAHDCEHGSPELKNWAGTFSSYAAEMCWILGGDVCRHMSHIILFPSPPPPRTILFQASSWTEESSRPNDASEPTKPGLRARRG